MSNSKPQTKTSITSKSKNTILSGIEDQLKTIRYKLTHIEVLISEVIEDPGYFYNKVKEIRTREEGKYNKVEG